LISSFCWLEEVVILSALTYEIPFMAKLSKVYDPELSKIIERSRASAANWGGTVVVI
jgi:hypothetical protein